MNQDIMCTAVSVAIRRGLLACGLLLGLTGCPESGPVVGTPTLSAALIQRAYIKASNPDANDVFSSEVALDGDTLVVGAPTEDSSAIGINGTQTDNTATSSGGVYVFIRTGGNWTQQAYVKASNTEAGDLFGTAVALSGDTLVVGAPQEDSNATGVNGTQTDNTAADSGAVYVFTRTGGNWTQQAYVKASNTDGGDRFGESLALSGDTLVVGATGEASNATGINGTQTDNTVVESGAVYVFTRTGGNWTQQAYVKASNTEPSDHFGYAVALSGETLVVGSPNESSSTAGINGTQTNNNANNSGAVYVFTRTGGNWMQQAYVKASNTEAGDLFGNAVALSGDTLVVGAPREASAATGINGTQSNNNASNSGAVYVFTRSGDEWMQQAYLKASNADVDDRFGTAVTLSGNTLVVGAIEEGSDATGINGTQANESALDSGAVYVFMRSREGWAQQSYVKASNTGASDNFGAALALSGDTLIVGAFGEDSNATGVNGDQTNNSVSASGAVYVFQ